MKYTITLLVITLLVSCKTGNSVKETNQNPICKKWELSVINGDPTTGNLPFFIELTKDHKVSGFAGCNTLTGTYVTENKDQIKFNQLGVTKMACSPEEMAMESKVLERLNTTENFAIENGKLTLSGKPLNPIAVFFEKSDHEIVNKYWKLVKLKGAAVQMAENQEREQFFILRSNGNITGFAGCNHFSGQYEITNGNRISMNKNMAITLKICPDVKVDENAFLEVFKLTDNYTIHGDTLTLNVGRRAPLAVFEAIYF